MNTIGPLILFQSFASLLSAAGGAAKFVVISSVAGQIAEMPPFPIASYGISKAGANYIAKKIDQEYEDIISFPMQYVSQYQEKVEELTQYKSRHGGYRHGPLGFRKNGCEA